MITLKQLRHALALETHGHFHRAAEAEHISQPALSRSIRALETQLAVPLFDRQGTGVVPTPFGAALLERARRVLGETDELLREVELLRGVETGSLHVAMGLYAAEVSAAQAVGQLVQRYPGIHARLQLTSWKDLAELVKTRSVDLAIGEISTLADSPELEIEPVGQHRLVLFCRRDHPLAGRAVLHKEDLDLFPTAMPRLPPRAVGIFPGITRLDPETGDLQPTIEVDNLTSARMVISNSNAFGIATPVQIEPWLERGEFMVLPFSEPWMVLNYGFIYLHNRTLAPAARIYMDLIRQIEGEATVRNEALLRTLNLG
jgi:DNA-binding transcriptional LysR family regulator